MPGFGLAASSARRSDSYVAGGGKHVMQEREEGRGAGSRCSYCLRGVHILPGLLAPGGRECRRGGSRAEGWMGRLLLPFDVAMCSVE
jgi:hypothetical protein